MRSGLLVVLVLIATAFSGRFVQAAEPNQNYVLFPITTDLQRILLFSTRADVYAQFDVAEVAAEGKFDPQRFDKELFRKDLAALAQQSDADKPALQIYFRYAGVSLDPMETKAMESAIKAIGRDAGFNKVGTGGTYQGGAWRDKLAKFASFTDDVDATESPIEDELARVYPVRTAFSRFLLGDPSYDCVVELRQPIDGRFSQLSGTTRQVIGQRVAQLNLPQTRKLNFRCLTTTAGRMPAERFFVGRPPLVAAWVNELGFESSTYSSSLMSVSPEDLLGKPAPDFTLDALAGGKIHLREAIQGRVAVIAFWGVACGACRVEAPHLTALQNQYRDKGLAVIAVNGYDESQEDVEKYVRDNGFTHSIALMGRKVAQEKYTVASYPVTFLVDRTGAIVDYHLGFEPGDEKLLESAVARLLDERQSNQDRE